MCLNQVSVVGDIAYPVDSLCLLEKSQDLTVARLGSLHHFNCQRISFYFCMVVSREAVLLETSPDIVGYSLGSCRLLSSANGRRVVTVVSELIGIPALWGEEYCAKQYTYLTIANSLRRSPFEAEVPPLFRNLMASREVAGLGLGGCRNYQSQHCHFEG